MNEKSSWLSIAQGIPLNSKIVGFCPTGCSTSEKAYINHSNKSYWIYCNKCGYTDSEGKGQQSLAELRQIQELNDAINRISLTLELPSDYTTDIPLIGRLWLYKGGITEPIWTKYKVGYSDKLKRVILPVYNPEGELIWYQCRALHKGQKPKYIQPAMNRDKVLFYSQTYKETSNRVVIVEDILSAIRVGETIGTIALLGTKITTPQATILGTHDLITMWLDNDRAGRDGAYKIRRTMGLVTSVTNIVTDTDPKDLTNKQIKEQLCKHLK